MTKSKFKLNCITVSTVIICLTISIILLIQLPKKLSYKLSNISSSPYNLNNVYTVEEPYLYVSDLPFMTERSGWGSIVRNKTNSNTPITLKLDSSYFPFEKGIWAHATSTIEIDLRPYKNYEYFTTYYGVNQTSNNQGNGVKFYIYTSVDGKKWDLQTSDNPKALKSSDQAVFAKIDITEANYLRLYAHDNNAQGNDHSVWADARLVKATYQEENAVKSLEEYDEQLIKLYQNNQTMTEDYELKLLQREFVKEAGMYTINKFAKASKENQETLTWLMDNLENLKLYLLGGAPDGSYYESLNVLSRLYHTYKDDFNLTTKTKYGNAYKDLYKKMAITLSLTHSTNVGLWMDPNVKENQSDPVKRYQIFKSLHKNDKFVVSKNQDHTPWFEALEIEELRFVLNNIIDDEEILWLNEYTQKYIDEHPNEEETYLQPHKYMKYIWPDYSKPEYYAEENKLMWSEKYGNFLDYGITYKPGVPKLWMNLDNGAVCGGISKIGSNIRGVHGTPSSVISQPGHAALIYYRKNAQNQGYWTIDNDVSGWPGSGRTERLSLRMPLGWGDEEYIDYDKDWLGLATYVLLAQGALNDYSNYQASREIYYQASIYPNDLSKQYEIYRASLAKLPINIDAWYGLIKAYRNDPTKTEEDFYNLGLEILDNLKYYPLPMYHLAREIYKNIPSVKYNFLFSLAETRALNAAAIATSNETIQQQAVNSEAKHLLGIVDKELAIFSFDGENANNIVLADKYNGSGMTLEYSLDNKQSWTEVDFNADEAHQIPLSADQINTISADNDIYLHIIGTSKDNNNLYKIDIEQNPLPTYYNNDLENRLIGVNNNTEWKINDADPWTSYSTSSPDLTGNKTIQVRVGANQNFLPSEITSYTFTMDNQSDNESYIPISHLSVEQFSTEAKDHDRYASYSIDGNLNTHWHSDWNGNDKEKYIILKLDRPYYLTALEYVPRPGDSLNGRVTNAKIEVSLDNATWQTIVNETSWSTDTSIKKAQFAPAKAQYVKFTGVETYGNFITASMFNLYEDTTIEDDVLAGIAYSNSNLTNEDVTARLVNPNRPITILNNNGSSDYTFTENGTFTFEYVDEFGNHGSTTANVDWIDKTAPTAQVDFNTTSPTNKEVMATITFNEKITLFNDNLKLEENPNGTHTLTFEENADIILNYQDLAGNIGQTSITVDWIDTQLPTAYLTYDILEETSNNVTVSLNSNEEVTILNNNGSSTYTFTENGTFTFEIADKAGNIAYIKSSVDWIKASSTNQDNPPVKEENQENVTPGNQTVTSPTPNPSQEQTSPENSAQENTQDQASSNKDTLPNDNQSSSSSSIDNSIETAPNETSPDNSPATPNNDLIPNENIYITDTNTYAQNNNQPTDSNQNDTPTSDSSSNQQELEEENQALDNKTQDNTQAPSSADTPMPITTDQSKTHQNNFVIIILVSIIGVVAISGAFIIIKLKKALKTRR